MRRSPGSTKFKCSASKCKRKLSYSDSTSSSDSSSEYSSSESTSVGHCHEKVRVKSLINIKTETVMVNYTISGIVSDNQKNKVRLYT